ncbi:MAG: GNAT family N-acetyltransferase [Planctomycetes bacterium]|nr:GNAT family N-acetyltransferase [Planctomycetota bacterium]MBI3832881.1 GNAT family N-acetyltransferase [Planctomycetota bacterium]
MLLMNHSVTLRDVEPRDLPTLFEHQYDRIANEMAAFPARERDAFMAHWTTNILGNTQVIKKAILFNDHLAGNIGCFERDGMHLVGYWIGREFWGKGVATKALTEFVTQVKFRPLHAYVAKHNVGSVRVLEKCGFTVCGEDKSGSPTGGEEVEEYLMSLNVQT